MKKYLPLIATIFLLNGCTLTMEDFDLPEEERGMDEAYTEQTDFGEVTYQFADSVVNLTENLQDQYLVDVVNDSTIKINGNIPRNYRPYVGMKIFAGYGYNFPRGLNGRVIEVTEEHGIYKVVTTKCGRDDIFSKLSYSFDYEGVAKHIDSLKYLSDKELELYGYQRLSDSTIVYWADYDSLQAAKGNEKAKARIQRRRMARMAAMTRAQDEEDDEDHYYRTGDEETEGIIDWAFDSRDIVDAVKGGKTFFTMNSWITWFEIYQKAQLPDNKWNGWKPYIAVRLTGEHHYIAHSERDVDLDFEASWTDTWDVWNVGIDIGVSKDFTKDDQPDKDAIGTSGTILKQLFNNPDKNKKGDIIRYVHDLNLQNAKKKMGKNFGLGAGKDDTGFHATIILGPWVSLIIDLTGEPIFEVNGCISASFTFTTEKRRSGTTTIHGVEEPVDHKLKDSSFKVNSIGGKADIKIGYTFRFGIGFLVANSLGVSVGANLEFGVAAQLGMDIYNDENPQNTWFRPNGYLKFYVDFYCDVTFHLRPLGLSIWDKQLLTFPEEPIHLFYKSIAFPADADIEVIGTPYFEDGILKTHVKVNYTRLGSLQEAITENSLPMVKLFAGGITGDSHWMWPVESESTTLPLAPDEVNKVETGEDYFYCYEGYLNEASTDIHFVPVIVDVGNDKDDMTGDWENNMKKFQRNTFGADAEAVVEVGPSCITTEKSQQIYGGPNFNFDAEESGDFIDSGGGTLNSTGGGIEIDPSQLSMYKFATKLKIFNATRIMNGSCKLYVAIYNKDKKVIAKRWVKIKQPKSGTYTYIFQFVTDWKPKNWGNEYVSQDDEVLYYRVLPYWSDAIDGEKKYIDSNSKKYYEIKYRIDEVKIDTKSSKWGTVMPEVDLNTQD